MSETLRDRLANFKNEYRFEGKGALSLALFLTDLLRARAFPMDTSKLVAPSGGQVAGLNPIPVQRVLRKHGIDRTLSTQGGRTSRGSIGRMQAYVGFLNALAVIGELDFDGIEAFWVNEVRVFFAAKPLRLNLDRSNNLRVIVRGILRQALERQRESTGTNYVGAVMQHLVGAKLDCLFDESKVEHHSFSTSDEQSGRHGDFLVGQTVVHVTTTPTLELVQKCRSNLQRGLKPIIVTSNRGAGAAEEIAENEGIAERIDVFEIEQFLALNFYELGRFDLDGQFAAVRQILERYNEIVSAWETDPSMLIAI